MHRRGLQVASTSTSTWSPSHSAVPLVIRRQRSSKAGPHSRARLAEKDEDDWARNITNRIVNQAALGESMNGWRHSSSWRGEEQRLQDAVGPVRGRFKQPRDAKQSVDFGSLRDEAGYLRRQTLQRETFASPVPDKIKVISTKGLSNEQAQFLAQPNAAEAYEVDDGETPSTSPSVDIGSFVEVRRGGFNSYGVKLNTTFERNVERTLTLTSAGELWQHDEADIMFVIPGFVPRDLVSRCGLEYASASAKEKAARVEVLRRVREFERAIEAAYNGMAQYVPAVYDSVRAKDPKKWSQVSVAEAAKLINHETIAPIVKTLCVHKHLMNRSTEFVAHPIYYRATQTFDVRPQAHVEQLKAVNKMVRSNDPALDVFASKVRDVIVASRRRAVLSYHEPPQRGSQNSDIKFEGTDRLLVDFLLTALHKRRFLQTDPYIVPLAAIFKKVDAFDLDLPINDDLLQQLLAELGVISPWQDLASRERDADLDQAPAEESPIVKRQDHLVTGYLHRSSASTMQSSPLGPEDFYLQDTHEAIRHDFGDLPVYVIDDAGAEELDDGVSIEPVHDQPGAHWVHVHIADPTAVIPPTHVFAQHARDRLQTSYFNHRTWPMIPRSLMHSRLSLGVMSRQGLPEQVMTFSAKVDAKGQITELDVRAGLVRNVHILRYDDVDAEMGVAPASPKYPFGPPQWSGSAEVLPSPPISTPAKRDLEELFSVSDRLVAARRQLPVFFYNLPRARVKLATQDLPASPSDTSSPTEYHGFPHMSFEVNSFSDQVKGARGMVAEMMQAACRVAARFVQKLSAPAVYRGAGRIVTPTEGAFQELLSLRQPDGSVDFFDALRLNAIAPAAQYSVAPAEHWILGIPRDEGYLRVTSPLRRYEDLVNHWQLKALLLPRQHLPFGRQWLQDTIGDMTVRGQVKRSNEVLHERFWLQMFLRRWLNDPRRDPKETTLFDHLNARVLTEFSTQVMGAGFAGRVLIEELGLLASMESSTPFALGDRVQAKLKSITVGLSPRMLVVPVE